MKMDMTYVDRTYEFKGKWDLPSQCGLKIVKKPDKHIVIATDLYDRNPGTSVTEFCAELATLICTEFALDPEKVFYIEHCPDRGSDLEAYSQTFDRVKFQWDGACFSEPDWNRVTKQEVDQWLGFTP